MRFACRLGQRQRLGIQMRDHQKVAGRRVGYNGCNQAICIPFRVQNIPRFTVVSAIIGHCKISCYKNETARPLVPIARHPTPTTDGPLANNESI